MFHHQKNQSKSMFEISDYLSDDINLPSKEELILLDKKINVDQNYNLPGKVIFCKKCVISNQRPRIVFDDIGVCSACRFWEKKLNEVNWLDREKEFKDLCDFYRKSDGTFDVIVPFSGGKDSIYVALELKNKYKMNPLTVTWSPHMYTEIGFRNFQASIHSGINNILITPNGKVHRRMTRISTNIMGDPFQPFIYGQTLTPLKIAEIYNIPFVVYGENGEVEYGGAKEAEKVKGFNEKEAKKYLHSGVEINYFKEFGFKEEELYPYQGPKLEAIQEKGIKRYFYSYFHKWLPQDNYYYSVKNANFKSNPRGRSEGTFSKYASLDDLLDPYHYYFSLLKFGLGRATSDAAHEIREDLIEREEGVHLVNRFDTEEPSENTKKIFLKYTGFSEDQLIQCIEKWRNEKIWKKIDNSWFLKENVS